MQKIKINFSVKKTSLNGHAKYDSVQDMAAFRMRSELSLKDGRTQGEAPEMKYKFMLRHKAGFSVKEYHPGAPQDANRAVQDINMMNI